MSKLPLVEGVLNYVAEENISFCMPGHKGGAGFLHTRYGKTLYENFIKGDITEVDGVDNLHHPEGIIKEAEELLSKYYASKKSYFLVNGSTSGNLAMIFSCFNEGDKIIVERNCHRSIFNAIIMRKLKPIYIKNRINNIYNAPLSIDREHFLSLLEKHKDAKGVVLTYPNYYGICCDLQFIIEKSKKYNMKVLVDSAHGAHFAAHEELPKDAVLLGAHMVVMSAHKTLPSLTQTAYLHVNEDVDIEKVDFYVSSFLSTSPSYMLMCSMDYGRYFLEEYGREEYSKLLKRARDYREKINRLQHIHVLTREDLPDLDIDETRYIINVEREFSGHKLLDYLRVHGIQAELSDDSNIVLIFSPFNTEEHFNKLYDVIKKCDFNKLKKSQTEIVQGELPKSLMFPYEVMEKKKRKVSFEEGLGCICGNSIVPYPPGIPILMMGEEIDKNAINMIRYYLDNKVTVLGIEEKMLYIVEEK